MRFCYHASAVLLATDFDFLLARVETVNVFTCSMPAEPLGLPRVGLKLNSGGFFYARMFLR